MFQITQKRGVGKRVDRKKRERDRWIEIDRKRDR